MKKVLLTSAAANMIWQFNKRNIEILLKQTDVEVHVATNFIVPGTIDGHEVLRMLDWMKENGVVTHQIDFKRGMGSVLSNIKVVWSLRRLIKKERINVIHTQSPIGSVLTRLANVGLDVKLIYTAHGFHFFKGATKKYWVAFYPLEYVLSKLVDVLITINDEDYQLASKFKARRLVLIPGVGVDVESAIQQIQSLETQRIRDRIRGEMNLTDNDVLILNVGELSKRKNQIYLLEAIKKVGNPRLHVAFAGIGPEKNKLKLFVSENGLENQVQFLGYRRDITNLHYAADLNVFPSKQEGLALGGLESVIDGLYILGSDRRGIRDYILSEQIGRTFPLTDGGTVLVDQLQDFLQNPRKVDKQTVQKFLMKFDNKNVDQQMNSIYREVLYD